MEGEQIMGRWAPDDHLPWLEEPVDADTVADLLASSLVEATSCLEGRASASNVAS